MDEIKGDNGTIAVDGGVVIILTHRGLRAEAAGLVVDEPRRIPSAAVSGVNLKPANAVLNSGWLSLGLGGLQAPDLGLMTAPSDPNTITFTYYQRKRFAALYEWLQQVVAYNHQVGVDWATIELTRRLSSDPASKPQPRKPSDRGPHRAAVGVAAGLRPDIAACAARNRWDMQGKRYEVVQALPQHLLGGETVKLLTKCGGIEREVELGQERWERRGHQMWAWVEALDTWSPAGILALTDTRLLFSETTTSVDVFPSAPSRRSRERVGALICISRGARLSSLAFPTMSWKLLS